MKSLFVVSTLLLSFNTLAHTPSNQVNRLAKCTVAADVLAHPSYREYRRETKRAIKRQHDYWDNPNEALRYELDKAERKLRKKARKNHMSLREVSKDFLYSQKCHQHHYDYRYDPLGSIHINNVDVQQTMVQTKNTVEVTTKPTVHTQKENTSSTVATTTEPCDCSELNKK